MRNLIKLLSILLFLPTFLNAQEAEWTSVNPWDVIKLNLNANYQDNLYFFNTRGDSLQLLNEDLEVISSEHVETDFDLGGFLYFDESSFAIGKDASNEEHLVFFNESFDVVQTIVVDPDEKAINPFQLKDNVLVRFVRDGIDRYSFFDPSTGEEYYTFDSDDAIRDVLNKVADDFIYLKFDDYVIRLDENEGIVDTLNLSFEINDISDFTENSISVSGESEYIFILDKVSLEVLDSFKYPSLDFNPGNDAVLSHAYIDGVFYVKSRCQFFYTDDLGETWSHVAEEKFNRIRCNGPFVHNNDKSIYFIGFGLEKLDLETKEIVQLTHLQLSTVQAETVVNESTIVFINSYSGSTYDELWQSNDFGKTWEMVNIWDRGEDENTPGFMDINMDLHTIYYSTVSSKLYFNENPTTEWEEMQDFPNSNVQDVFITNNDRVGLITDNEILISEQLGEDFNLISIASHPELDFQVIENQANHWLVGKAQDNLGLYVWRFDDDLGISNMIKPISGELPSLSFDSNNQGQLIIGTDDKVLIVNPDDLSVEEDCVGVEDFNLLKYHNQDSVLFTIGDSRNVFLSAAGCDFGNAELFPRPLFGYHFPIDIRENTFFNEKFEGLNFLKTPGVGATISVFREPFSQQNPTSTEEFIKENKIEELVVFPNPTTGEIYFKDVITIDKYQIVNSFGQMVQQGLSLIHI